MMEVFSPEEDEFRDSDRPRFARLEGLDPKQTRVFYFESNGVTTVSKAVSRAIRESVEVLDKLGYRTEPWRPKGMWRAPELWISLVPRSAQESAAELLGNGVAIDFANEWRKTLLRRSSHGLASLLMATLESVGSAGEKRYAKLREQADALRRGIEEKLGEDGVLICPVYPGRRRDTIWHCSRPWLSATAASSTCSSFPRRPYRLAPGPVVFPSVCRSSVAASTTPSPSPSRATSKKRWAPSGRAS